MTSLLPWHRLRLATGVALVLLAGALLAPPAARAGCGDYVVVGASGGHARPMPPHASHPAPAKPNAPCTGPHCSRRPVTPPAAPVAPVSAPGQEWACVIDRSPADRPEASSYLAADSPPRPVRHGLRVYHPPR